MIETERLLLRPWRASDRGAFGAIVNTPLMTARLGGVRPERDVDAIFARRLSDQLRHGHSYWAVEVKATREIVGSCGLRVADDYPGTPVAGMTEMGWRIAEHLWGRGLARESAEASVAWAWSNLLVTAIGAWTTSANTRSWGLMERLGMQRRCDLDFHHPRHAADDPTGKLIVYVLERPQ